VFVDRLRAVGAQLSESQLASLEAHYRLLVRWNRVLNLTRIEGEVEVVERNYGESLWLAGRLPAGPLRVVDIGSGAGFPGIPLAIARRNARHAGRVPPEKGVFLKEAVRDLANASVLPRRIEDVEETFDWAVIRAVRWQEVAASVVRVARNVALLGGGEAPVGGCAGEPGATALGQAAVPVCGSRIEHS